jgi:hypothetical protein
LLIELENPRAGPKPAARSADGNNSHESEAVMKSQNQKPYSMLAAGIAGAMLIGGCAKSDLDDDAFFTVDQRQELSAIFTAQAQTGAKADAMLQPYHFAGGELNSLGAQKLDLMLPDVEDPAPLVVYLNLKDAQDQLKARQTAVANYLLDSGLTAEQFQLQTGRNPASWHMAQPHLLRYDKTESPSGADGEEAGETTQTDLLAGDF